jgi:hypothetical protein
VVELDEVIVDGVNAPMTAPDGVGQPEMALLVDTQNVGVAFTPG